MKNIIFSLFLLVIAGFSAIAQIPDKAEDISPLLIGETIPNTILKATDGSDKKVLDIIGNEPTVLMFYRGGWCPFCNIQLAEIQNIENEIIKLGYNLVAISPDSPDNLKLSDEKLKLNYKLYSDANGSLCKAIGIAFRAPDNYSAMLNEKSDGLNEGLLPVPSVFIVDTSGKILFEYINPDYKTRLSSSLLLAVLQNLKESK